MLKVKSDNLPGLTAFFGFLGGYQVHDTSVQERPFDEDFLVDGALDDEGLDVEGLGSGAFEDEAFGDRMGPVLDLSASQLASKLQ